MPNLSDKDPRFLDEDQARECALVYLQACGNPFADQVTTIGTADDSIHANLPELIANQLSELQEIIEAYRYESPATRAFILLGERDGKDPSPIRATAAAS